MSDQNLAGQENVDRDGKVQPSLDVDAISQLARERRETAERKAAIPRPDYVTDVELAEVMYYFATWAVPYKHVDAGALVDAMSSLFGMSLGSLDISPLLETIPNEQLLSMTEEDRLERLIKEGRSIIFLNGKFMMRNNFVKILSVELNFESILVRVAGVTSVAEAIAQDVMELQWKLAGSNRSWSAIADDVRNQGYATATRVELGELVANIVDARVTEAIEKDLTTGHRVARHMGHFRPDQGHDIEISAPVLFDGLTLKVSRFSPRTGTNVQSEIDIQVTAKNDHGRGRVLVSTSLDYENHLLVLEKIVQALQEVPD